MILKSHKLDIEDNRKQPNALTALFRKFSNAYPLINGHNVFMGVLDNKILKGNRWGGDSIVHNQKEWTKLWNDMGVEPPAKELPWGTMAYFLHTPSATGKHLTMEALKIELSDYPLMSTLCSVGFEEKTEDNLSSDSALAGFVCVLTPKASAFTYSLIGQGAKSDFVTKSIQQKDNMPINNQNKM